MTEAWERNYTEIAQEAGETDSPMLSWPRLFKILRGKHEPIAELADGGLKHLAARMKVRQNHRKKMFVFDTDTCSFCRRAAFETGAEDYGSEGRTCAVCVLAGKCFDESWVVRKIYMAIMKGNYPQFRAFVRQGLRDIQRILEGGA